MSQFQQESSMQDAVGFESDPPSEFDALLSKEIGLAPSPIVEALSRAEMDVQIQTAKRFPRSLKKFYDTAVQAATMSEDVAASCMYALPRGKGDPITGPSVRMAEIVASAWGNIRVECRIVEIGDTSIVARGMCIDLEGNNGQSVEVRRRITDKFNKRYGEDMIGVTAQAAISIARRNAIFAVIPRAYVIPILAEARKVAVGEAKTLGFRRTKMLEEFSKLGVKAERVFASVGVVGEQDITLDKLATLRGYFTSIKTGEASIETVFPDPAAPATNGNAPRSASAILKDLAAKNGKHEPAKGPAEAGAAQTEARGEGPQHQANGEQPSAAAKEPPFQPQQSADEFLGSLVDVPPPAPQNGRRQRIQAPQ